MIYTLTFNPALDYIINVPDYKEGVVNRSDKEKILPGGKGINVSIVLKNLGFSSVALGFVAGFTGEKIVDFLEKAGVDTDFVQLLDGNSRINVKIKAGSETEINGQGPRIDEDALDELYKKLDRVKDGDFFVIAGSVPSSIPQSVYCDILEYLSGRDIKFVVDTTGELLTNALRFKPFLIKPNIFELGEVFGKVLTEDEEIISCAKKLQDMGAKNVLVSKGGDGAVLVLEDGKVLHQKAPCGKVINTTGAGDSMVAGFISGYIKTDDFSYALKLGVMAGSASSFSENLATKEDIELLTK